MFPIFLTLPPLFFSLSANIAHAPKTVSPIHVSLQSSKLPADVSTWSPTYTTNTTKPWIRSFKPVPSLSISVKINPISLDTDAQKQLPQTLVSLISHAQSLLNLPSVLSYCLSQFRSCLITSQVSELVFLPLLFLSPQNSRTDHVTPLPEILEALHYITPLPHTQTSILVYI